MKKAIFTALAALFALASQAQNGAIDALVDKYVDRDGFTVLNMEGEAIKSLGRMISGSSGTISVSGGEKYDVSELLDEIVSITAVVLRSTDEAFSAELRGALDAVRYTPIVSHNDNGTKVRIVSADIRRGRLRGNSEVVAIVDGPDVTALVRMIGKIDTDLLARLIAEAAEKGV